MSNIGHDSQGGQNEKMPLRPNVFTFGPFTVTPQVKSSRPPARTIIANKAEVFHHTPLSYCLVNIKPLLPGHVLIIPIRPIPRVSGLTSAETSDLFLTASRVGRMIERVYGASSLNIAIQDGPDAGQSVPHVHVHVIPRKKADLDSKGGSDAIYEMMDGEEGDVGGHMERRNKGQKWTGPDNEARKPRSEEEMNADADMLRKEMDKEVD
ncbi:MAG: hypothetical protein Q9160_005720 [Pyrenula sp. 1 TL-2023]